MTHRWLTVRETARLLNISVSTVRKKIREGKIPVSVHGKPYRVDSHALENYERRRAWTEAS